MEASPTVIVGSNTTKVLVVDDDVVSRRMIAAACEKRGWIVFEAEDGETAIEKFSEHLPQLVTLDWQMPGLSGPEVAHKIRSHRKGRDAYLLLASGRNESVDLLHALRSGADDCISKPFEPMLLEARLLVAEQRLDDRREYRTTRSRLRHAQTMESIGTLARGIAHDINNALGPIIGYTQLVQRAFSNEDKNYERLETVLRSCQRAKQLVEQVLAFSRMGRIAKRPVSLARIAKQALLQVKSQFGDQARIDMVVPEDLPEIDGEERSLIEVFANVLTNAVEAIATKPNARVRFTAGITFLDASGAKRMPELVAGSHALITIEDEGIGIPLGIIDKVFDPFFTTKERQRVTGMGLSVAHGIIRGHDGAIDIKSTEGKGTRIRIWLPCHAQDNEFGFDEG